MPSTAARVAGFLPSRNGLHFGNSWPRQPAISVPTPFGALGIGDASKGLCGGIAYAVKDFYEASVPIPPQTSNPPAGSPLYRFIVRRLIDSWDIPTGVLCYLQWQAHSPATQRSDTATKQWPKIKTELDAGALVALGVMRVASEFWPGRLGHNHQVLAYGYDLGDSDVVTLRLYDPNHHDRDDVTLSLPLRTSTANPGIVYAVGGVSDDDERTYGCFVTDYTHVAPPAELRPAATPESP